MSVANNSSVAPMVVNFSSQTRADGTNENFISSPITFKINKFDSVCLLQASVPKSTYNISPPYNTFLLREGITQVEIVIPPASYTAFNLIPVLQTTLNTASPNGFTYKVYYNSPTWLNGDPDIFKYYFEVSGNGSIQPSFTFNVFNMEKPLGFDKNTTTYFSGSKLISPNCINLSNITRCFIKSNIVVNAYLSILEEVLNYGDYGPLQQCYYQQYSIDLNSREFNNSGVNSWQFILVDANDSTINLNGVPWSFSVVFYQRNNIHELQGLEMKIQNELRILELQKEQENLIKQVNSKGQLIDLELNKEEKKIVNEIKKDEHIEPEASTPQEVKALDPISEAVETNKPIFPVLPYGSSVNVKDITKNSSKFPTAREVNKPKPKPTPVEEKTTPVDEEVKVP